jgi:hypothetical protein
MASNDHRPTNDTSPEVARVSKQLADRLRARGVAVHASDSADDLGSLMEAVEAFESAVESKGGDLMVDEAPAGKKTQPDNARFALPERKSNESPNTYISHIESATSRVLE